MVVRKREGSLTKAEKPVVKALLAKGWRNQDIQALVNIGRTATINSARITGVKQDSKIKPADDDDVEFYLIRKRSYDLQTGLNLYDDERLIRAREAMLLAVQAFNSPTLHFKTEVFAILANVAWTYLMHEFYIRKKVPITKKDGHTLALSQMLERQDCPLSSGIKANLKSLKTIRDSVEHKLLRKADAKWLSLFQACALNFEKTLCDFFGDDVSLQKDLSVALQFAKLTVEQAATLEKYQIPENIEALDAEIRKGMTEEQLADLEYEFRVIYTLVGSSKGRAHIEFVHPDTDEAAEFRNVLIKRQLADELYPHKPGNVVQRIKEKVGKKITLHDHTQAWKKFKARPHSKSKQPENTNKDYCIYHPAHGDYTYSDVWVDFLVDLVSDPGKFKALRSFRD